MQIRQVGDVDHISRRCRSDRQEMQVRQEGDVDQIGRRCRSDRKEMQIRWVGDADQIGREQGFRSDRQEMQIILVGMQMRWVGDVDQTGRDVDQIGTICGSDRQEMWVRQVGYVDQTKLRILQSILLIAKVLPLSQLIHLQVAWLRVTEKPTGCWRMTNLSDPGNNLYVYVSHVDIH